ncbi:A-kinase anchor protein 12 [Pelodytes ibericus]
MGAGTSSEQVADKNKEENAEQQNDQGQEQQEEQEVEVLDAAGDAKLLQKNGKIAINGTGEGEREDIEVGVQPEAINEQQDEGDVIDVGQQESSSVLLKEEAAENKDGPSDTTPKEELEEAPEAILTTPESEEKGEAQEQANENQSNEVGFKKVFKFVGFKFTVKKEKTEKSEPVQLLTVKKDEIEVNDTENNEEQSNSPVEDKPEENQQQTNGDSPVLENVDVVVPKAESPQETQSEILNTEEEAKVEKEQKKSPVSPTSPLVAETSSPFKKFFTQGWAGLRKKTSFRKSKEEDPQEVEKHIESEEQEKVADTLKEEEPAETEQKTEDKPAPEEVEKPEKEEEIKTFIDEEIPALAEEESKPDEPPSDNLVECKVTAIEEIKEDIIAMTENIENTVNVVVEVASPVLTELSEVESKVEITEEKIVSKITEIITTTSAPNTDEPLPLVKSDNELGDKDARSAEALTLENPELASSIECVELEKSQEAVTTEAELLSSQEKAKLQGSPLRKLFSGSGLRKLSGKKHKGKKEEDTKVEDIAEQAPASSESPEAPNVDASDSSPSSPDESGETSPTDKVTEDTQQTGEAEGEGATSDGERKRDGITPWASFKKLVTPKKRPKRPSESDKEDEIEKVKSSTMSSTESAGSVENQEETKETSEEQKLEKSSEENKKKVDSSVSWEALICVGSSKKRARKSSDSDEEEEQKNDEEIKKIEEDVENAKDLDTEGPQVSSQEKEHDSPSPDQANSPTEGDGVSTWQSFKRLVTPRRKSKTRVEDKIEEPTVTSSMEQSTSEGEAGKEETWVSLKKLIPGRKKKKSDAKQDQGPLSGQGSTQLETTEDDSDEPAVVPLAEFDAAELEKLESQQSVDTSIFNGVSKELLVPPEKPVDGLLHAVTVTVIEGERAVTSMEERSPSWISATVTETIEKPKSPEDSETEEQIKRDLVVKESFVFSTVSHAMSETRTTTVNEVELTSEALTALEEAIENSCAEETTEMVSAVSQLGESVVTTEEVTPVPEDNAKSLEDQKKITDQILQEVAEKAKLSVYALISSSNNADAITTLSESLESEITENVFEQVQIVLPESPYVPDKIEVKEDREAQVIETSTWNDLSLPTISTLEEADATFDDAEIGKNRIVEVEITSVCTATYPDKATERATVALTAEGSAVVVEEQTKDQNTDKDSSIADQKQTEESVSETLTVENIPILVQEKAEEVSISVVKLVTECFPISAEKDTSVEPVAPEERSSERDSVAEQQTEEVASVLVSQTQKDVLPSLDEQFEQSDGNVNVEVPVLESIEENLIWAVKQDNNASSDLAPEQIREISEISESIPVLGQEQAHEDVSEKHLDEVIPILDEKQSDEKVPASSAEKTDENAPLVTEEQTGEDIPLSAETQTKECTPVLADKEIDNGALTDEQSTTVLHEKQADDSVSILTVDQANEIVPVLTEEQIEDVVLDLPHDRVDGRVPDVLENQSNYDKSVLAEDMADEGIPNATEEQFAVSNPVLSEDQTGEFIPEGDESVSVIADEKTDDVSSLLAKNLVGESVTVLSEEPVNECLNETQSGEITLMFAKEKVDEVTPIGTEEQGSEDTLEHPEEIIPTLTEEQGNVSAEPVKEISIVLVEEKMEDTVPIPPGNEQTVESVDILTAQVVAEESSLECPLNVSELHEEVSTLLSEEKLAEESTAVSIDEKIYESEETTNVSGEEGSIGLGEKVVVSVSVDKESSPVLGVAKAEESVPEVQETIKSDPMLNQDQESVCTETEQINDCIPASEEKQILESSPVLLANEDTQDIAAVSLKEQLDPATNMTPEQEIPECETSVLMTVSEVPTSMTVNVVAVVHHLQDTPTDISQENEPDMKDTTSENAKMYEVEQCNVLNDASKLDQTRTATSTVVEREDQEVIVEDVTASIPEFESSEANKASEPITAAAVEEQVLSETVSPIAPSQETVQLTHVEDDYNVISSEDHEIASGAVETIVKSVSQKAAAIVDAAIEVATSCLTVDAASHDNSLEEKVSAKNGLSISWDDEQSVHTEENIEDKTEHVITIESHSTTIVQKIIETAVEKVVNSVNDNQSDKILASQSLLEQCVSEVQQSGLVSELSSEEIIKQEYRLSSAGQASFIGHNHKETVCEPITIVPITDNREELEVAGADEPQKEVFDNSIKLEAKENVKEDLCYQKQDVCKIPDVEEPCNEQSVPACESVQLKDLSVQLSSDTVQITQPGIKPSVPTYTPEEEISTQDDCSEAKTQETTPNVEL